MAIHKLAICFLLLASFLTIIQPIGYSRAQSSSIKSYRIQTIPFERCETISKLNKTAIVFAEYGKEAKVIYPAPDDMILQDESAIIKKCKESLAENIDEIIKIQDDNKAVADYLTSNNELPLFSKDDHLNLLVNPAERNIQVDPETKEITAEFRSEELVINADTAFCIYLTFICKPEKETIEKIIISPVKLK